MNNQQLKEFRTKFGNIKASQSSSRLSNLPALIDDATTGGTAAVKERPLTSQTASQRPQGSTGMVELNPQSFAFQGHSVTELGSGFKPSPSAVAQPATQPWQPTTQLQPPTTQLKASPASAPVRPGSGDRRPNDVLERLQTHAEHQGRLPADSDLALREFQKLARDLKVIGRENGVFVEIDDFLDWSNLASQAIRVERTGSNSFLITTKLIDMRQARYDAEQNAETIRRYHTPQSRGRGRSGASAELSQAVSLVQWVWQGVAGLLDQQPAPRTRRGGHRATHAVAEPTLSLQSSLMWLGGAIFVRLGLDLMLAANPSLWFVAIAVIAAPAIIALFRVARSPQNGFVMGVNLFLIMIGLLVGGRF